MNVINLFKQRRLFYQATSQEIPIKGSVYCGFDPTAPSLHLGNLVSIINLFRLQQIGFTPIAVIGGATAKLGDPSLKLQERDQLDINLINTNAKKIQYQIENIFQNMANLKQIESKLITFDNSKIYEQENLIEFISNVGRKFRVNSLIAKDHIKQRLVDPNNGLSLTELFYTILQSYDFAYLSENFDCTLQIGGSDQWGNITNGCDFVKKQYKKQVYGITSPLLVDSKGAKFGKSEGNALFLDQQLTTPNDIRQYIINLPDQSIENYLYMLTLLDEEQIKQHMQQHITSPNLRIAQNLLADQLLLIIHNTNEKYKILFQTKFQTIQAFDNQQMAQFMNNLDSDIIFRFKQDNRRLIELLTETKLQKSKTEIRKLAQEGALKLNDKKVQSQELDQPIQINNLLHEKYLFLKLGKKTFRIIILE